MKNKILVRYTFIFISFLFCFACKNSKTENLSLLVKEWDGKKIKFPSDMAFTILGKDTVNYRALKTDYTFITYVDSAGCTLCKLKLEKWKELINSLSNKSVSFLFIFHTNDIKELSYVLKRDNFIFPICLDKNDSFNKLNKFPPNIPFQTFLINRDNKIVVVGNPVYNRKVKELCFKIITGKTKSNDKKMKLTKIVVEKSTINFGRFKLNKDQDGVFILKNIGNNLLSITDVSTSCGCTSVNYSHEPIKPGNELLLHVKFKAEKVGYQQKQITVYCNADSSPLMLDITGFAQQ